MTVEELIFMFWSVKACARNHCKPLKLWMAWKWDSQVVLFVQICDSKNTCKYTHCFTIFARMLLQHNTSRLAVVHVIVSEWKKTEEGLCQKAFQDFLTLSTHCWNTYFPGFFELFLFIPSSWHLLIFSFCFCSGCLYVGCGARQKLKLGLEEKFNYLTTIDFRY